MCGIFAYIGSRDDAAKLTLRGLKSLEYRGYDSWGVAVNTSDGIFIERSTGKISGVSNGIFDAIRGHAALGHSRWATHGGVSVANAHPHANKGQTIAVVHNGIIENHQELRTFLVRELGKGDPTLFVSETDTEVIPHLIDYYMSREGKTFEEAFVLTARRLRGRSAIVAIDRDTDHLLAMRDGSPLVLGIGEGGTYLASDVPAFLEYTQAVNYLDDREYVKVSSSGYVIKSIDSGEEITPRIEEITWAKDHATKSGYDHYMLKEIMEQPDSLARALLQDEDILLRVANLLRTRRAMFTGCGTAAKMSMIGAEFMNRIGEKFVTPFFASEFPSYLPWLVDDGLLLAVSQSGETADVLEAMQHAKKKGTKLVSLLNVVGSSMHRMSDEVLFINAGPERAVASTKAATAQIAVLFLFAHAYRGSFAEGSMLLRDVVAKVKAWINIELVRSIWAVAEGIKNENDIYIIGRGLNYPVALESAIKIQEVSYVHAEGFAGGELKHGPIALIRKGSPCIAFVPNDETQDDMVSNATELKARGGHIIGVSPVRHAVFDEWIATPDLGDLSPIAGIIPIQILAYHLSVFRGNDPDMPRNLAKSVTVK